MRIIYVYHLCVIFPTQKTAYKGTKAKLYCRYNINLLLADIIMRWYTYGKKKFNFFYYG